MLSDWQRWTELADRQMKKKMFLTGVLLLATGLSIVLFPAILVVAIASLFLLPGLVLILNSWRDVMNAKGYDRITPRDRTRRRFHTDI